MQRNQISEDPRAVQSNRGSSEAVSTATHPSERSGYMSNVPEIGSVSIESFLDDRYVITPAGLDALVSSRLVVAS